MSQAMADYETGMLRRECAALRASIARLGNIPGGGRFGRPGSPRRRSGPGEPMGYVESPPVTAPHGAVWDQ